MELTLIVPFYNEELLLQDTIHELVDYLQRHLAPDTWELLLVDDGSRDASFEIAKQAQNENPHIKLLHHRKNFGLGAALQTGFNHSLGDFVIVLDADLSYSPDHILKILKTLKDTGAKVVIASPYMKEGRVSHIPWTRTFLSKWANRFLALLSNCPVNTLTGMVRGYEGPFIRNLSLRAQGEEINPEIIYKAHLLDKNIQEIPAHLSWEREGTKERSKIKIFRHTSRTLLAGFLIKPVFFFILPGLIILLFALYTNAWMIHHFFEEYADINMPFSMNHITDSFKNAYHLHQHTFLVAFLSLMLAIQLLSTGLLSLQNKHYFEELFSLGTKLFSKREKK